MLTVVIGGGISGLACAFELKRRGQPVFLLEKASRVGGVIQSAAQDGFLFELGPQSCLTGDALLAMVQSLGLENQLQRGDSRAPRYVWTGGRLHPVPMAPPALLGSSLLGLHSKLRLLSEPFRKSRPPANDESMAQFVRRKFGDQLLDNLVGPFVSGVYAGDPEMLSVRAAFPSLREWEQHYGSVIRGAMKSRAPKGKPRPTLCSFQGGLSTLVAALQNNLGDSLRLGFGVESVRRLGTNGSNQFELRIHSGGHSEAIRADAVIVAAPADAAAGFLAALSTRFAELLGRIGYNPVAVVSTGYRREHIGHPLAGFGFLVPRKERLNLLGTVWSSSLFPGRAPEGMVSLASFAGGATNPQAVDRSDDQVADIVEQENARILQITGAPVTRIVRRYSRAIPQFNLGHPETRDALRAEAARFPGLFFCANYMEGPAIPACVEQAVRVAGAAHDHLTNAGM